MPHGALGRAERLVVLLCIPDAERQCVALRPDPTRQVKFLMRDKTRAIAETTVPLPVVPIVPAQKHMAAFDLRCNQPLMLVERGSGNFGGPRGFYIAYLPGYLSHMPGPAYSGGMA